jgi:hypothetical protein
MQIQKFFFCSFCCCCCCSFRTRWNKLYNWSWCKVKSFYIFVSHSIMFHDKKKTCFSSVELITLRDKERYNWRLCIVRVEQLFFSLILFEVWNHSFFIYKTHFKAAMRTYFNIVKLSCKTFLLISHCHVRLKITNKRKQKIHS